VTITASLSAGAASDLVVEHFVDDLDRADEPVAAAPLRATAQGVVATLPGLPAGSIVRYRIRGRRGKAVETISPRPADPFAWHAYFVNPPLPATRTYQLFISPARWTAMWTNLSANGVINPNAGCLVNPTWNERVPAVLVADGQVYDVRVRYQGSRSLRRIGTVIASWPHPGPSQPQPLLALSWNISFPRYAPLGKRRKITLKKQYQSCPGVLNAAMAELYWAAGVPSDRFGFARLHVNGGYYDYVLDVDGLSEEILERYEGKGSRAGDLFKADGASRDEGPWGRSDFSPLAPSCNFTAEQRYATTYERQTNDWKAGPADPELVELRQMIEGLAEAKAAGLPAVRAFFEKHFDVSQLLTCNAMRNFLGVWDDGYHNYQLYKRLSDGKWLMFPLDLDWELGGDPNGAYPTFSHPASSSLFVGEAGNGSNRLGAINLLKDALLKAYRGEFEQKVLELAGGVLAEERVLGAIDDVDGQFSRRDWLESPAAKLCDVDARVAAARAWIKERHLVLRYLGVR
jgi:spore coat protein CotH